MKKVTAIDVYQGILKHINLELMPFLEELEKKYESCHLDCVKEWLPDVNNYKDRAVTEYTQALTDEWHYAIRLNGYWCFSYALQFDDEGKLSFHCLYGPEDELFLDYNALHEMQDGWESTKQAIIRRVEWHINETLPYINKNLKVLQQKILNRDITHEFHYGREECHFKVQEKGKLPSFFVKIIRDGSVYKRKSYNLDWQAL